MDLRDVLGPGHFAHGLSGHRIEEIRGASAVDLRQGAGAHAAVQGALDHVLFGVRQLLPVLGVYLEVAAVVPLLCLGGLLSGDLR